MRREEGLDVANTQSSPMIRPQNRQRDIENEDAAIVETNRAKLAVCSRQINGRFKEQSRKKSQSLMCPDISSPRGQMKSNVGVGQS